MKRLIFLSIIALVGSLSLMAQRPERPKFDAKVMASKIVKELNEKIDMSASVKDSVEVALVSFFNKMDDSRQAGERPNIESYEKERDLKVKTFLTDEQYKIYSKFMEERKPKGKRPDGSDMNGRPQKGFW